MKPSLKNFIPNGLFLLIFLMVFGSCTEKNQEIKTLEKPEQSEIAEQVATSKPQKDSLIPPVVIVADSIKNLVPGVFNEVRNDLPVVSRYTDGSPAPSQIFAGKGAFTHIKNPEITDDGQLVIQSMFFDNRGNLWLSYRNGQSLVRYNGKTFEDFSSLEILGNRKVYTIFQDSKDDIWIVSDKGLVRYNGKTFITFTEEDGLNTPWIRCFLEDKNGILWIGTVNMGLVRYDGEVFTYFNKEQGLAGNDVTDMVEDSKGDLWIATNEGLSKFDGEEFTNYTDGQGVNLRNLLNIALDKEENIWLGSKEGLTKFDQKEFVVYTKENGLAENGVGRILVHSNGDIWMSNGSDGLVKFDGEIFTNFSTYQGFQGGFVYSLIEDIKGNIWIASHNGLGVYEGDAFIGYTTETELSSDVVWSLSEFHDGTLWLGSDNSYMKFDGKGFFYLPFFKGFRVQTQVEDKDGKIYLGTTQGGFVIYDGNDPASSFDLRLGNNNNSISSILPDSKGNVWIGSFDAVLKYDGNTFVVYNEKQGVAKYPFCGFLEDKKGDIWVAAYEGLSKISGDTITTFTVEDGLKDNLLTSIIEDRNGNIWIGTNSGLSILPDSKGKESERTKNLFLNYGKEQGLPGNNAGAIREDKEGNIIIGGDIGIFMIPADLAEKMAKGENGTALTYLPKFNVYNHKLGNLITAPTAGVDNGGMLIDGHGILWVGNSSLGIVRANLKKARHEKKPPKLVLENIKINEEILNWYQFDSREKDSILLVQQEFHAYGERLIAEKRDSIGQKYAGISFDSIDSYDQIPFNLILPYAHNHITFDFAAIEPLRNNNIQYQYILEGYDKEWSSVGTKSFAQFGNMREGNYIFKVKAKSEEDNWTEPLTYTFKVLPPWYRTWWMYLTYALLAVGIIILIVRWNSRILRERAKKLQAEIRKATRVIRQQKEEVEVEKKKSDDLLLNILPEEVAEELKEKGESHARLFDEVTVLFTDFVNFTHTSEQLTPTQLVEELNACFTVFDRIIGKYGLEKIKTIGDAYLAVCGLPTANDHHAENTIKAALEIRDFMVQRTQNENTFEIRIGLHSGSLVAGIVGIKKFAYDIWGDTVNTAARMEQHGEAGKVNISEVTFELVKDSFECSYRGKIPAKNKGEIDMYFVENRA